jgi:hypothetical protein
MNILISLSILIFAAAFSIQVAFPCKTSSSQSRAKRFHRNQKNDFEYKYNNFKTKTSMVQAITKDWTDYAI